MKFGVIQFPGSNCERDCLDIIRRVLSFEAHLFDYREEPDFKNLIDCLIIPGGFSFGDYLRTGAIAKTSPIMPSVMRFASQGGLILGICNGFQILTEAGLLPGVLLNNTSGQFMCKDVEMKVLNNATPFTNAYDVGEIISMPIAHASGNYTISEEQLLKLRANDQIILEYMADINGSTAQIAGVCNENKNVFGLMPHPERCCERELGGTDGLKIFESLYSCMSYSH